MPYKLPKAKGTVEQFEEKRRLDTELVSDLHDAENSARQFLDDNVKPQVSQFDPSLPGILSDDEIWAISAKVLAYCEAQAGVTFHDYQRGFGMRLVYSVLVEDVSTLTALFSRQSGKTETVAVVVDGLLIILPILAELYQDPRITKFRHGFWVGIFGPTYELAGIMYNRMRSRIFSAHALQVLRDPDIAIDLSNFKGKALRFPNGSFVDVQSAGPGSKIEGKTYHLCLLEECQDIPNIKIRKSIHPMLASTAGPKVKIGTPNPDKNDFYDSCTRNKERDNRFIAERGTEGFERKRTHFEYDYTHAARCNPRYAKYVQNEMEELGFDSDEFRMSYRLHWLTERNRFITQEILDKCAVKRGVTLIWKDDDGEARGQFQISGLVQPVYGGSVVIAADFGKVKSSTVLTAAQVWYEREFYDGQDTRYRTHVLDWLELEGDDHEQQHGQIMEWLGRFSKIYKFVGDATGKGDPILSRLRAELESRGTIVVPFVFSTQSKHDGYTVFSKELYCGRFTFPFSKETMNRRVRRFYKQMLDLSKTWKGRHMVVEKQADDPEAKDDYCDSAMMLCWGVNVDHSGYTEELIENPFLSDRRGYLLGERRQRAAWQSDHTHKGTGGRRGQAAWV